MANKDLRDWIAGIAAAGELKVIAMAAFPHRIISAVAKRTTASLKFRCGQASFISSSEPESQQLVPQFWPELHS